MSNRKRKSQTPIEALAPIEQPDTESQPEPETPIHHVTMGEHFFSEATALYLEKVAAVAKHVWAKILGNPGHVPAFRIVPGLPQRGALGSASKDAQTFSVVPTSRKVTLLRETVTDPANPAEKVQRIVSSPAGTPEQATIADKALILLSPLTYTAHTKRDKGETRSTFDMLADIVKAFLFLSSGYAPGVPGTAKLADLKTLIETIRKAYGSTFEPTMRVQMDRTVTPPIPKRDKAGEIVTRADWTAIVLPSDLVKALSHAILDAGLDVDPPAELRVDFLNYMKAQAARATTPLAKVSTKVNGKTLDFRLTYSQLRDWLSTVAEGVDTLTVTLKFSASDIEQARSMRTKAEAAADREAAIRNASGVLSVTPNPQPRIGPGPAATV